MRLPRQRQAGSGSLLLYQEYVLFTRMAFKSQSQGQKFCLRYSVGDVHCQVVKHVGSLPASEQRTSTWVSVAWACVTADDSIYKLRSIRDPKWLPLRLSRRQTIMRQYTFSFLVAALQVVAAPTEDQQSPYPPPRKRCTAHDSCWPSLAEWSSFNASVGGRLIASRPTAAVCHDPTYTATLCKEAIDHWTSGYWRADQVGGYSAIVWELGDEICLPQTAREQPCHQGLVAPMTLDARSVEDIQAGIRFASKHDLYLTIKNTGHDHLGRSSGDGSFAIWTHNIRGREWHNSFVPTNAPEDKEGLSAVTLRPGEVWLDVYHAADEQGVIVVGGSARTVGAVGGYLLGGGHSPWSYFYGLAADNLLQATIVTPCGEHVVLNEYTDPDYFWAIRGGGGNSWGALTSVTYQTFPPPSHIQVVVFQANMSTEDAYRKVYTQALKSLPAITENGYTGYGATTPSETVMFIFFQPNGTNATLDQGFAGFNSILQMNGTDDISVMAGNFFLPTWQAYTDLFVSDPNIATNIQDASRLLTADVLLDKAEDIVELALKYADMPAGHNFSKSSTRDISVQESLTPHSW